MDSFTFLPPLWSLAVAALGYIVYTVIIHPKFFSALRDIPGPAPDSLFFGNLAAIFNAPAGQGHHNMIKQFGPTVRYHGMLGDDRLVLTDPASLAHVLGTGPQGSKVSYEYPKPNAIRGDLGRILGYGVLFAEGDDHKRQRKIMNPAFGPAALRALVPTFFALSYDLRDRWNTLIDDGAIDITAWKSEAAANEYDATRTAGEIVVEIGKWMSRITLDIIGQTGFGYDFKSLAGESSELASAFSSLTSASGGGGKLTPTKLLTQRFLGSLVNKFPAILTYLPNKRIQAVKQSFAIMSRESQKILDTKRKEASEMGTDENGAKDLITLLLKSNTTDAKAQMSDDELMGQMTTFILAGHETTSTMLTWTLWTLARFPLIQARLRKEIRTARRNAKAAGQDELSSDELNGLEYLDAVTREILRLESAVVATIRTSTKADIIPLSTPIISTVTGQSLSSISIPADQTIFLSIYSANRNKEVFGDDADEFRPERWLEGHVGEKVNGTGVYAGLLTFLAGPRSCVGYKFAILELKSILSVLVDDFAFAERSPALEVERRSAIVMRPFIVGEEDDGSKMPLKITRAVRLNEEDNE